MKNVGGADAVWGSINSIPNTPNLAESGALILDTVKYGDYLGIKLSNMHASLAEMLRNDSFVVFNATNNPNLDGANNNNSTGSDLGDYNYRLEHEGIRFGVLANIYNSVNGPLSTSEWAAKYSNNSFDEPYFAVTKRFRWDEIELDDSGRYKVTIAGGDCYLNYTYKRAMYGLGVEGIPNAVDTKAYLDGNVSSGLFPKGFVFPVVNESNYNSALRTRQTVESLENSIYGQPRTFYPIDNIENIRASRQIESKGYNQGYNYDISDRIYSRFNDRAPVNGTINSNRFWVSERATKNNFVNGYTNFSGFNFRDYEHRLGQVIGLISHSNYLYAIFETGVGIVPISVRTFVPGSGTDGSNGVFVDSASIFAERMNLISSEIGTRQKYSIVRTDEAIYFYSEARNSVVSIGGTSLKVITDFSVQSIFRAYRSRVQLNDLPVLVKGNFDRERNQVIFSFFNIKDHQLTTDIYLDNVLLTEAEVLTPIQQNNTELSLVQSTNLVTAASLGFKTVENNADFGISINANSLGLQAPISAQDIDQNLTIGTNDLLIKRNNVASIMYDERLKEWVSRFSWNPIFTFNLGIDFYSFDHRSNNKFIWKHYSEQVPLCNFYGEQHKFVVEYIIVDKAFAQKILENLVIVSNKAYPSMIAYTIDTDENMDTFNTNDGSYLQFMKRRKQPISLSSSNQITQPPSGPGQSVYIRTNFSLEECQRLKGGLIYVNEGELTILNH